jgi:hypothetical protein
VLIWRDTEKYRDQSRNQQSAGEDVRVHRAKDYVWWQAYFRGRDGFRVASENEGGPGLIARGVVTSAEAIRCLQPAKPDNRRHSSAWTCAQKCLRKDRVG